MARFGSRSHFRPLLTLVAVLAVVAAACGDDGEPVASAGEAPLVVVTTTVIGDVVSAIVGDAAEVEVVMPPGSDPHDFEPSARQAARLRDAEVVVVNGLGLEVGLASTLDAARSDGVVIIEVGELIEPLPFGAAGNHDHDDDGAHDEDGHDEEDEHGHDEEDEHGHGDDDPHFWHDPNRMIEAIPGLVDALVGAVPGLDHGELSDRADTLIAELRDVDAEVERLLDAVPAERRYLLTNHDTFGYFADRYGFEVIGTVIPGGDTLASPSASELADLVHEIEAHQLPAIFAETVVATSLAETVAAEVGFEVAVVTLHTDSLGDEGSGASTYAEMLLSNARLVAGALG